jgi:serine protease Do
MHPALSICRFVIGLASLLVIVAVTPARGQVEAEGLSASFRKAAKAVLPAVVTVREADVVAPLRPMPDPAPFFGTGGPQRPQGGSGFVVDAARGLVLTNDHVVPRGPRVVVTLPDGRSRPVRQVRRDPKSDLALVTIDPEGLTQVDWGDSEALDIGDWVLVVGQPFGLSGTVTAGIVSGKGRGLGVTLYEDFLQTDAAINPGNSGGPMVDLKGQVVGISTAIKTVNGGNDGIGFAIPAARARRVAAELAEVGRVRRGYIGIRIGSINPEDAARVKNPGAVLVTAVADGTPASASGLHPGDMITTIDNKPVIGPGMLQAAIEVAPIGEPLTLGIVRNGQPLEVGVKPAEQPEIFPADDPIDRPPFGIAPFDVPLPPPTVVERRPPAQELEARAPERFPELGLRLAEATPELARRYGYAQPPRGLFVRGVDPDGPADRAGLEIGMVLTDANNRPLANLADFRAALADRGPDKGLVLRILKGAKAGFRVIFEGGGDAARPEDVPAAPRPDDAPPRDTTRS